MVTVAVAGGTGQLGLTIVEVLKQNSSLRVIALSRKTPDTQEQAGSIVTVNYADVDAVARSLETNGVHTVISAINIRTAEGGTAEVNLVAAASKSSVTKRFMASDWSPPIASDPKLQLPQDAFRLATLAALRKTDLEWTSLHAGQIADYLGTPHIPSHLPYYAPQVDMAHRAAAIPGTGDGIISFTYSYDLARFVEAALGLPRWDEEMYCYSECCSLITVVRLAEEATGVMFNVTYDSVEKLERGEMTELPAHTSMYPLMGKTALQARFARFGLYTVKGMLHMPEERSLNRMFPEIRTKTIGEIVGAWKGK